jgi:hypothetical protein
MAETRLRRVLWRIIHLRSIRSGRDVPTGRQAIDRPLPQVGSRSVRWLEFDMRKLLSKKNRVSRYLDTESEQVARTRQ